MNCKKAIRTSSGEYKKSTSDPNRTRTNQPGTSTNAPKATKTKPNHHQPRQTIFSTQAYAQNYKSHRAEKAKHRIRRRFMWASQLLSEFRPLVQSFLMQLLQTGSSLRLAFRPFSWKFSTSPTVVIKTYDLDYVRTGPLGQDRDQHTMETYESISRYSTLPVLLMKLEVHS